MGLGGIVIIPLVYFLIMSAKAAEAPLQHILILSAVRVTLPVGIK